MHKPGQYPSSTRGDTAAPGPPTAGHIWHDSKAPGEDDCSWSSLVGVQKKPPLGLSLCPSKQIPTLWAPFLSVISLRPHVSWEVCHFCRQRARRPSYQQICGAAFGRAKFRAQGQANKVTCSNKAITAFSSFGSHKQESDCVKRKRSIFFFVRVKVFLFFLFYIVDVISLKQENKNPSKI